MTGHTGPEAHVVHQHHSGRYDRSPKLLRTTLAAAIMRSDLITLTELISPDRIAAARSLPGWALSIAERPGPASDSAVLYPTGTWIELRGASEVLISEVPGRPRAAVWARLSLLRHHDTGRTLLVAAVHMPAGVESTWRARGRTVAAHITAQQRLRRTVNRWRRKHQPDAAIVVADWNLNLHRGWVRAAFRSTWPRWTQPATKDQTGDLGKRLISWPLTRRTRAHLRVLPQTPASDHRPIRLAYLITPRSIR